jgi:hypothetical protein
MFYAPGLLYIHFPHAGGTFVTKVLEKHRLGSRQISMEIGGHDPVRNVPPQILENTLTFATLRDPWSWYASVDARYRHKGFFDGFLHDYFRRSCGFKDMLKGLVRPGDCPNIHPGTSSRYPGARVAEEGLPGRLASSGLGLYSWMVLRMFGSEPLEDVPGVAQLLEEYTDIPWGIQALIDSSQLREGLSSVVSAWRPDLQDTMVPAIMGNPAENEVSRYRGVLMNGQPDPSLYDREMQDWVRQADGWVMRRFGFDEPIGRRPAVHML